jgi:hypothetical protein
MDMMMMMMMIVGLLLLGLLDCWDILVHHIQSLANVTMVWEPG